MTFYYDLDDEELIGNNAFHDEYGFAEVDGDSLVMDVSTIMEDGRGLKKLREMRNAIEGAIEDQEVNDD